MQFIIWLQFEKSSIVRNNKRIDQRDFFSKNVFRGS